MGWKKPMKSSVDKIVSQIAELSLERDSDDSVRNIYMVLMDINIETGKIMRLTREQERES